MDDKISPPSVDGRRTPPLGEDKISPPSVDDRISPPLGDDKQKLKKIKNITICNICFTPNDENSTDSYLKCPFNNEVGVLCSGCLCSECLGTYIKFSLKNNNPPVCIATDCDAWYSFKLISSVGDQDTISSYLDLVYNIISRWEFETLNNTKLKSDLIAKLFEDRLQFLLNNLSKSLLLVAKAIYSSDLDRISNQYKKEIEKLVGGNSIKRKECLNLLCKGYLDDKCVCILCNTKVCSVCGKEKVKYHRCKSEDVNSIVLLNTLVECPGCNIKIKRSLGCNHMTCAVCGQNFDYETGKTSEYGSENEKVKLVNKHSLYREYADLLPTKGKAMLLLMEKKAPIFPNKKGIHAILTKFDDSSESGTRSLKIKLCLEIEKYKLAQNKYKDYIRQTKKLELAFHQKDVDLVMGVLELYR